MMGREGYRLIPVEAYERSQRCYVEFMAKPKVGDMATLMSPTNKVVAMVWVRRVEPDVIVCEAHSLTDSSIMLPYRLCRYELVSFSF
jgi:hypothetical protein